MSSEIDIVEKLVFSSGFFGFFGILEQISKKFLLPIKKKQTNDILDLDKLVHSNHKQEGSLTNYQNSERQGLPKNIYCTVPHTSIVIEYFVT